MNKCSIVLTAVLLLSAPGMALAQNDLNDPMAEDRPMPMMGHAMMDHPPMDKDAKRQGPMMKPGMMPIVVATSDGGVVVLMGRTMTKYDQDLDEIGSVELKPCPMCEKMLKSGCPMMAEAMKKKTGEDAQVSADATTPSVADVEAAPVVEAEPVSAAETPVIAETSTGDQAQAMIEIKPAEVVENAQEIKSDAASLDAPATGLIEEVKSAAAESVAAVDAAADVVKDELTTKP